MIKSYCISNFGWSLANKLNIYVLQLLKLSHVRDQPRRDLSLIKYIFKNYGARKKTRTSTRLPSQAPEACASTNSAIRARIKNRSRLTEPCQDASLLKL